MTPTLHRLLADHARHRPDAVALVVDGRAGSRTWSFAELHAQVSRLAAALSAAGITKGDKVATVLPNGVELVAAYLAAAATGVVVVPCSTLLGEGGLRNLINDSDSKLVIADPAHAGDLNAVRASLNIADGGYIATGDGADGFTSYDDFTAAGAVVADTVTTHVMSGVVGRRGDRQRPTATPTALRPGIGGHSADTTGIDGDDPYNIMYSSGTTGAPKGIVHSHYTRAMYCALFAGAWRMSPESVALHAGSLVFNGAMLTFMPWLYLGCRFILHKKFDADAFIDEIAASRVTHVVLVPAQIIAILNSDKFAPEKFSSLEMLCSLGAPLHLAVKQKIFAALPGRFYELYGVTEGFMTILDKHDAQKKPSSVGRAAAFTEVCILDDDRPCPAHTIGEICGRGPLLMQGYYKQPAMTAQALKNGWLHSGDLGYLDDDGFVFLVERKKDMFISGGANVYPRDIEEVVVRHPRVTEVAVFGAPHPKWGEAAVAAVTVTGGDGNNGDSGGGDGDDGGVAGDDGGNGAGDGNRAGDAATAADLIAWVNARVDAKYQRLADAVILKNFPRNAAGKILKRELRKNYRR